MFILNKKLALFLEKRGSSIAKNIRAGNLSPENIEKLKAHGLIKSKSDYIEGIRKGNANMMRKGGIKMSDKEIFRLPHPEISTKPISIGPYANAQTREVIIPHKLHPRLANIAAGSQRNYKKLKPFLKRHEVDEIVTYDKIGRRYKGNASSHLYPQAFGYSGHFGPEVLQKEKKLIDYYKRVHGNAADQFSQIRQPEYQSIEKYKYARNLRKGRDRALKQDIRINLQKLERFPKAKNAIKQIVNKKLQLLPKTKDNMKFAQQILKALA